MSDGPMNGLLLGASGGFDNDEAIGYPQADADLACNESDLLNIRHHHGQGLARNLSPQWSSHIDASAYQTEMARADPRRFSHLTVTQDAFFALKDPFDLNAFENVNYGSTNFDQSFGQVRPHTTAWEGSGPMDTRYLDQYMPDVALPHQPMQGALLNVAWQAEQHQGPEQAGRTMTDLSFHHLQNLTAMQQSQNVHNATGGSHYTPMNMYRVPDGGSHGANTGGTRLDQDPSSVQSRNDKTTIVKSLVCPICKHKSKNRPAFRHHLDIHDPAKTGKFKCDNEGCRYASRYPKDVRRHALVHNKPDFARFVCHEPGCDGKFDRNDNLLRHGRLVHPDSSSAQSTGTKANSRLPLESLESTSNQSAGASLNNFGFVVDRTSSFSSPQTDSSSFNRYLDPRVRSPETASDSFCFSETESPFPK